MFFGPSVAHVFGARAEAIDNRSLAAFPQFDDGWDYLPKLQAWAIDHLPLRGQAVQADTALSQSIFAEAPSYGGASSSVGVAGVGTDAGKKPDGIDYPQVIQGSNDWLYFGADAAAPCQPEESIDEVADGLQTLTDAAAESGRTLLIVVAPDKSTIHPEFLPDQFAGKDCMAARKTEFNKALSGLSGANVVDLVTPLKAYEQEHPGSVWRSNDTHWTPQGAEVFTKAVVSALEPSLLDSTSFELGSPVSSPGDLARLLGTDGFQDIPPVTAVRPGVTLSLNGTTIDPSDVPAVGYSPIELRASSTSSPLYEPTTVLLGDSFFDASRTQFAPFFSDLWYVHNMSGDIPGATDTLGGVLKDADTVIYEVVERSAAGGAISYQDPANVKALAEAMRSQPMGGAGRR